MEYSYLIQLSEDAPTRVNAFRVGTYEHPVYGPTVLTQERLNRFAENINTRVRGVDLDIDYAHKGDPVMGSKAAGWVRSAEVEDDKLWLFVEWTDPAKEAIKKREYRYFSPEFFDEWTDAKGVKHKDVLAGGGITNRPFLKDLVPLNFEELDFDSNVQIYRDISTNERKSASGGSFAGKNRSFPILKPADVMAAVKSLGRAGPDNYSTDQIKANIIRIAKSKGWTQYLPASWKKSMEEEGRVDEFLKKLAQLFGVKVEEGKETEATDKLFEEVKALKDTPAPKADLKAFAETAGLTFSDDDSLIDEVKSLRTFKDEHVADEEKAKLFAETYPEVAKKMAEDAKRMDELEAKNKLMETDTRIGEWTKGENSIPPAVHDKVRDFRQDLSGGQTEKFDEIFADIHKTGLVTLEEEDGGNTDPSEKDAGKKFEDLIDAKLIAHKDDSDYDYSNALEDASKDAPDLAKAYVRS